MLESIYIGLTGLNTNSRGLQTISNNVANMNTPGFKASTLRFGDLFYVGSDNNRAGGGTQFGTGVGYLQTMLDFKQGDMRQTNNGLDLAIDGRGFLVLMDGDKQVYVRTGQFGVNDQGDIIEKVLGMKLGVLSPTGTLQTMNINGRRTYPPKATTSVSFNGNLSADAATSTVSSVVVYDADGGKHTLSLTFTNTAGATAGTFKSKVVIKDQDGKTVAESEIEFDKDKPVPGKDKINFDLTSKVGTKSAVVLDFSKNVTGYSMGSTSTLATDKIDGYAPGAFTQVSVDADGQLKIAYSNGQSEVLGKIALANFDDLQMLTQQANGIFEIVGDAPAIVGGSGQGGLGTIKTQATEASNVDLATEFGQLILYQRGYQASSQVISAANEMIQQLFDLRAGK